MKTSAPTQMGMLLREFFPALESKGIRYCVLRHSDTLPDVTTNDVDMLVDPQNVQPYLTTLLVIAGQSGWRVVRSALRLGILKLFLVCENPAPSGERRTLEIDCLWANLWKGIAVTSPDVILSNAQKRNGFWVASPGPSAAVLFAKEYLQYGRMGPSEKLARNCSLLTTGAAVECQKFVDTLSAGFGSNLASQIASRLARSDWTWFDQNHRHIQREIVLRAVTVHPLSQAERWLKFARAYFAHKCSYPPGLMIAFVGPDGSGKTTISRLLQEEVRKSLSGSYFETQNFHGRFAILPELKDVYNGVGRWFRMPVKRKLSVAEATRMLDEEPFHPLRSCIYLFYYTLDDLLGYLRLLQFRAAGRIVLFDRYFYDYLIHSTYNRVPYRLRQFCLSVIPQPQLVVLLRGDPRSIHMRKPELRVEQIERQQVVAQKLLEMGQNGYVVCRVDTALEDTLASTYSALLGALEQQSLNHIQDRITALI